MTKHILAHPYILAAKDERTKRDNLRLFPELYLKWREGVPTRFRITDPKNVDDAGMFFRQVSFIAVVIMFVV